MKQIDFKTLGKIFVKMKFTIKDGVKTRLVSIVNNALSTIDFARISLRENCIDVSDLEYTRKYIDEMKDDIAVILENYRNTGVGEQSNGT